MWRQLSDGQLAPGLNSPVAFKIRFPDRYSGPVRLSLAGQLATGPNQFAYRAYCAGQVRPILEYLNPSDGSSLGEHSLSIATYVEYTGAVYVDLASGGVPNEIVWIRADATATGNTINNILLDICEYNYSLSAKQDGANDAIVLVNLSGVVQ